MTDKNALLFSTFQLGDIQLNNRIVMAPMTRSRAHQPDLEASDLIATYYQQRATAGLIISEGTFVSKRATGYINVPGIYTEKQTEGWKKTTKAVQEAGGKIFAQLWHVGRISHPDFHDGELPLAPSAINPHFKSFTKNGFQETVTPKEMTLEEIQETIQDFKNAAKNAMAAGFDGVELHAANGYLFHQFFAKCSNVRTDQYGGSVENRARFLFEVLDALKEIMDLKRVGVRLNPSMDQSFGITMDETTEPTFQYLTEKLNDYPIAYVHLSGFSKSQEHSMKEVLETAKEYRAIYKGVLMINKGFDAESAEQALQQGFADLISIGVPFIGNPDLVERYKNNWPLNESHRKTFYSKGAEGYTDYPFYKE